MGFYLFYYKLCALGALPALHFLRSFFLHHFPVTFDCLSDGCKLSSVRFYIIHSIKLKILTHLLIHLFLTTIFLVILSFISYLFCINFVGNFKRWSMNSLSHWIHISTTVLDSSQFFQLRKNHHINLGWWSGVCYFRSSQSLLLSLPSC